MPSIHYLSRENMGRSRLALHLSAALLLSGPFDLAHAVPTVNASAATPLAKGAPGKRSLYLGFEQRSGRRHRSAAPVRGAAKTGTARLAMAAGKDAGRKPWHDLSPGSLAGFPRRVQGARSRQPITRWTNCSLAPGSSTGFGHHLGRHRHGRAAAPRRSIQLCPGRGADAGRAGQGRLARWLEQGRWHFFGAYCLAASMVVLYVG